ncbi:hypothetical protein A2U01_0016443, partial [Trifolium medium]|nr:hypothetical protein [Trifolium medium]
MEQMQIFTAVMKMHHKMILDASAGSSIKNKTQAATKELVEQMCQNEYTGTSISLRGASEQCTVTPRRIPGATTQAVCDEMQPYLALPGVGWVIGSIGLPTRMDATDMDPVAKILSVWLVNSLKPCSNSSEIIMDRCHAVYAMLRRWDIRVSRLVAASITGLVTAT